MVKTDALHSLQLERHSLSAFFKHPEIFPDVDGVISEYDYVNSTHRTIFCVIRSLLLKGEKLDSVIVGQKIKNYGVSLEDNIDIFKYLDTLSTSQITAKGGKEAVKELVKLRVRREICDTADKIKEFIVRNGELNIDQLVAESDKLYNEKISHYTIEDEPQDLFGGIADLIRSTGENPVNEIGLITPYGEFNRMFGGVRSGNGLYSVVSRPKHGKSTWLLNMAQGVTMLNEDTIVLYLDTEMQTEVNQFRAASAASQAPMWYLETGNWSRNKELSKRVLEALPNFEKYRHKIYHLNVKNRPIEQICSLIRRFYYKHIGRLSGRRFMVIYDYIKLTGEKLTNNWAEHQAIGEKINYLNDIQNELPNTHLWAAMQLNRSAEDGRDDSSAIAVSDRLQWFAAFVAIFRRKWLDEIGEDGPEFGTHKMIPTATRFQGKDSAGHHDMINVSTGKDKPKYMNNFINFNIENFHIAEKGTLLDVVNKRKGVLKLNYSKVKKDTESDGEI